MKKIIKIGGETYTSWYKLLKNFWYSADLKIWKIGWFQKKLKENGRNGYKKVIKLYKLFRMSCTKNYW